ncbi:MAG: hypothetical protein ABI895_24755 [Deltaproteobacteria bacterium]
MVKARERVLVGVFDRAQDAREAITDLLAAHFSDRQVGVLARDSLGSPELKTFRELEGNRAGTGVAVGAVAGASGGALWALGIVAGVLPAIGPVIAGGVLAAIVASAAGAAVAGGFMGALVGWGIPDEEAAYYNQEFEKGRTIVVVQDEDRAALAQTILAAHHAQDRSVIRGTLADQIADRSL